VPRSELKDALNLYRGDVGYLSTLRAGTSRLDLHGNEVGIVSRDDELRAAARLKDTEPLVPTGSLQRTLSSTGPAHDIERSLCRYS
jgi:sRNA-binding protein